MIQSTFSLKSPQNQFKNVILDYLMNFVIIEIVQENDNKITACKVQHICNDLTEAKKVYNTLKEIKKNKMLLVPNIKMDDIHNILISDYYTEDI